MMNNYITKTSDLDMNNRNKLFILWALMRNRVVTRAIIDSPEFETYYNEFKRDHNVNLTKEACYGMILQRIIPMNTSNHVKSYQLVYFNTFNLLKIDEIRKLVLGDHNLEPGEDLNGDPDEVYDDVEILYDKLSELYEKEHCPRLPSEHFFEEAIEEEYVEQFFENDVLERIRGLYK